MARLRTLFYMFAAAFLACSAFADRKSSLKEKYKKKAAKNFEILDWKKIKNNIEEMLSDPINELIYRVKLGKTKKGEIKVNASINESSLKIVPSQTLGHDVGKALREKYSEIIDPRLISLERGRLFEYSGGCAINNYRITILMKNYPNSVYDTVKVDCHKNIIRYKEGKSWTSEASYGEKFPVERSTKKVLESIVYKSEIGKYEAKGTSRRTRRRRR